MPTVTEISVVESDGQTLTCHLAREQEAHISWLHDGVPLAQTELKYTLRDDNRTLVSGGHYLERLELGDR